MGEDLAVFPRHRWGSCSCGSDRVHRVVHRPDDEHQPVRLHLLRLTGPRAHVAVGVLWLLTLWVRALQGKLGPAKRDDS